MAFVHLNYCADFDSQFVQSFANVNLSFYCEFLEYRKLFKSPIKKSKATYSLLVFLLFLFCFKTKKIDIQIYAFIEKKTIIDAEFNKAEPQGTINEIAYLSLKNKI
ncbi:hypothetical protein BpHYR1_038757 [Brachionus plicatilis]|uniref:Uncharacterized protein n=1 Tax=Brachionus plicatilis TaxID=10195 RepID=A0A3M7PGV4_BRAPC|nr:hypothetical protein BpHYR1_038757 [Brachionus plicatilis]